MAYVDIDTHDLACSGAHLCKSCCQDPELHELVTVYKLGGKFEYTVPCFPVFTVKWTDDIRYSRICVIYVLRPCVVG